MVGSATCGSQVKPSSCGPSRYLGDISAVIRIAVSADLLVDAQRDLKDIGCADLAARTKNITELPYGKIRLEEGVIFSTYSALCTKSKSGGTRLDQIIGWLGGKAISALEIAPRPISSDLIRSHPISSDLTIWSISALENSGVNASWRSFLVM